MATIVSSRCEAASGESGSAAGGTVGAVHVTAPVSPTGGVVQVMSGLAVALTNWTPAGSRSASTKFVEVAGP